MRAAHVVSLSVCSVALACFGSRQTTASAVTTATPRLCDQIKAEKGTISIDSRTPNTTAGDRDVRRSARRTVVVCHKNPFVFEYRVKADTQVIVSTAIADFVQAIYGFAFPETRAVLRAVPTAQHVTDSLEKVHGVKTLALRAVRCEGESLTSTLTRLTDYHKTAAGADTALRKAFHAESANAQEFLVRVTPTLESLTDSTAQDLELYARTQRLEPMFGNRVKQLDDTLKTVDREWTRFTNAKRQFEEDLFRAESLFPDCLSYFREHYLVRDDLRVVDATQYRARSLVHDTREKTSAHHNEFKRVVANPSVLYWIESAGPFDNATKITISVERKRKESKAAPYTTVARVPIHFGGPWTYKLGFGVGWASIATQRFGVAQRYRVPVEGRPGDSLASFITQKESSKQRIAPMLTLVGRLGRLYDFDAHLTLGATLPKGTASLYPELFTGVGARLYDDLSLSIGSFWANETTLADNLKVGQAFPSQEVPTKTRFVGRVAVLASYSVR